MINDYDWLYQRALVRPHGIALLFEEQHWTYAELNHWVADLAARFSAIGISRGNHVAVLMPNQPIYVGLIHALIRLGAVLVPLNVRLTAQELRWQLEQADCQFLIYSEETAPQVESIGEGDWYSLPIEQWADRSPKDLSDRSKGEFGDWIHRPLDMQAAQAIVYSSGTTGQPKGVMLSYANHFWSATASAFRLGTNPDDRWLLCMPLYHVGGLAIVLRACLYGITVVLQSRFNVAQVNEALDRDKITLVSLVPTMLQWLLEARSESTFPTTLRTILLGGAAASPALLARCADLPVATTYGLTEASSQVATAIPAEVRSKPGSVGKPLMFSQVKIVDEEEREVPPNQIGQIVVRGPTVMKGYYRHSEATGQALHHDTLYTGDLGYLDEDGDLWVVQRRTDLIVSGGENVYPTEVEQILLSHPAIKAACVVGVEDTTWGQKVSAAIAREPETELSEAEIISFCEERLARYKQPRLIRFVTELPQTASGKVQREAVKKLFQG